MKILKLHPLMTISLLQMQFQRLLSCNCAVYAHYSLANAFDTLKDAGFEEEALIEINNGCVCCTVRADLVASVTELLARSHAGIERLIVETSGLADPAPVLQTFLADPGLREAVELE